MYFSLHAIKCVINAVTLACDVAMMFSIDGAVELLLQVTGFALSGSKLEAPVACDAEKMR